MKRTLPLAIAALCGLAGVAFAAPSGSAPQPVPASDFRLVIKDVAIFDSAGAELVRHHCEWTEPQDDDRPCLAFSGDPQNAYREIQEAGGDSATVATVVPDLEIDTLTRIRQRSDGMWLFRTEGVVEGKPWYRGYVCSSDGRTCSSWSASSRKSSKRAIRAASARVKRRAR